MSYRLKTAAGFRCRNVVQQIFPAPPAMSQAELPEWRDYAILPARPVAEHSPRHPSAALPHRQRQIATTIQIVPASSSPNGIRLIRFNGQMLNTDMNLRRRSGLLASTFNLASLSAITRDNVPTVLF